MSKILHISKYYYPDVGGIENTARDVVTALKGEHKQKVLCFNHHYGNETDIIDDIEVIRCNCVVKIASQSISVDIVKKLKYLVRYWKPDYILLHWPNPFMAEFVRRFEDEIKVVIYWHSDIIKQKVLGKLFVRMSNDLLDRAYKIIATSENYIEGSTFLYPRKNKCVAVPSPVNDKRFQINEEIRSKSDHIRYLNKGKIICIALGRHVEYKGFRYLIDAASYLDSMYQIYIIGEGPLTMELKKRAEKQENIVFLGKLDNEELVSYMMAADIFCFPSITKNEAYGLALAEGMSFGKPAVTFTIPGSGVNFVNLDGITGIEVENRNSQAFANAIKLLGDDPDMRSMMGNNAKQRIHEQMSMQKFKRSIIDIFKET